jgi:two-component system chemotaxis response regulator CheB
MPHRDVIVIGASSGGVSPLVKLVRHLPPDLPAAIFVVLHVNPDAPSRLAAILNRAGGLPAAHAVDQEPIRRGRIYVAPPGFQMYVHRGHLSVHRGPHENLHRPAIDPMFRTAAHYYGSRVIGVVLSGALDDGSAGLRAVKQGGGIAIVQHPSDARVAAMPSNAMEHVDVDHAVAAADLAPLLLSLVQCEGELALRGEVALETVEEASVAGHLGVAAMFEARSRETDHDVRTLHDLIMSGGTLEPVGQEGISRSELHHSP